MRSTRNKKRVKLPLRQAAELQERNQGKEDILRFWRILTIFVKNERCTRNCAGVNWLQTFQVQMVGTHGMHLSPIALVSRLRNQWPFCIEEQENRVEGAIFQVLFDWIREKKIRRWWEVLKVLARPGLMQRWWISSYSQRLELQLAMPDVRTG